MFTVALLAQKGGVGKTTLTCTLATLATLDGASVAIIDTDPMARAWAWGLSRQKKQGKDSPPVAAAAEPETMHRALVATRAQHCDWVFIDTPAGVSQMPATAAAAADLLLIPCNPSEDIMDSMASTVKLVKRLKKPAFFVVNKGRSKAINHACVAGLVSAYGLPATKAHVSARMPIVDAADRGLSLPEVTDGDSAITNCQKELRALWHWLNQQKEADHVAA